MQIAVPSLSQCGPHMFPIEWPPFTYRWRISNFYCFQQSCPHSLLTKESYICSKWILRFWGGGRESSPTHSASFHWFSNWGTQLGPLLFFNCKQQFEFLLLCVSGGHDTRWLGIAGFGEGGVLSPRERRPHWAPMEDSYQCLPLAGCISSEYSQTLKRLH